MALNNGSWYKIISSTECRISVHAVPRASKTEICGLQGESLKIRLQAPPVDGKANKVLTKFLAEYLDLPTRNITLVSGQTGREKIFSVISENSENIISKFSI